MISFLQTDSASLSLWINQELIYSNSPYSKIFSNGIHAALYGTQKEVAQFSSEIEDPSARRKFQSVTGSIWHEKRHFLDLILTNFGASRIRHHFELRHNSKFVLKEAHENGRLILPIDAYADCAHTAYYDLHNSPDSKKTGERVAHIKDVYRSDRSLYSLKKGEIEVGGNAQLECLAYVFQSAAMQAAFGVDDTAKALDDVPDSDSHHGKYKWLIDFMYASGLTEYKIIESKYALINDTLLTCIAFASLQMRSFRDLNGEIAKNTTTPISRFSQLIIEMRNGNYDTANQDFNTCWELVNAACLSCFGADVCDEIEFDIKKTKEFLDRYSDDLLGDELACFSDYNNLRERIFDDFRETPRNFLRTFDFKNEILDRLKPIVVVANPSGIIGELNEDLIQLFGYDHSQVQKDIDYLKWTWAWTPKKPKIHSLDYAFTNESEWHNAIMVDIPIAKLMMNGFRHDTMLGPELVSAKAKIELQLGCEVKLIKPYDAPQDLILDSNAYWYQHMDENIVCDLSGKELNRENAVVFSKWYLLRNFEYAEAIIDFWRSNGQGDLARISFWREWSTWVVHKDFDVRQPIKDFRKKLSNLLSSSVD